VSVDDVRSRDGATAVNDRVRVRIAARLRAVVFVARQRLGLRLRLRAMRVALLAKPTLSVVRLGLRLGLRLRQGSMLIALLTESALSVVALPTLAMVTRVALLAEPTRVDDASGRGRRARGRARGRPRRGSRTRAHRSDRSTNRRMGGRRIRVRGLGARESDRADGGQHDH
jgi:hypothetical protein